MWIKTHCALSLSSGSPFPFSLENSSAKDGEDSDQASFVDDSGHRQPFATDLHVPDMDPRNTSVRAPLVPKPVLLVPKGAVIADGNLSADRSGSSGAPDGDDGDESKVLEGYEVRDHAEPREGISRVQIFHQRNRVPVIPPRELRGRVLVAKTFLNFIPFRFNCWG